MRTKQGTTKDTRKEEVKKVGYSAYITSAGWLGYDDDKGHRPMLEALHQGFNHFKMKVGPNVESDLCCRKVTRCIIGDPANLPKERKPPSPSSIDRKNTGPVLMIDANQVWGAPQSMYVKRLTEPG